MLAEGGCAIDDEWNVYQGMLRYVKVVGLGLGCWIGSVNGRKVRV